MRRTRIVRVGRCISFGYARICPSAEGTLMGGFMSSPSRRDVLKLGAAGVAAGLASSALAEDRAGTSESTRRPFKKAVMWDMIRGGKSVLERFQTLKEAGFDGVEMNSPG